MFKDYYQILDILPSATKQEIKEAYRKMSLRWHPDRNSGADVTAIMQDINEARTYAKDIVGEFLKNLKETSKVAAKGAWDGANGYIIGGVIATNIFALIRACH